MLVIASREGFLVTLSRLATLALAPLFDGLKLGFCVFFLRFLPPSFGSCEKLSNLASSADRRWSLSLERGAKCLHFIVLVVRIYIGET
jgi:hypothetical protein